MAAADVVSWTRRDWRMRTRRAVAKSVVAARAQGLLAWRDQALDRRTITVEEAFVADPAPVCTHRSSRIRRAGTSIGLREFSAATSDPATECQATKACEAHSSSHAHLFILGLADIRGGKASLSQPALAMILSRSIQTTSW